MSDEIESETSELPTDPTDTTVPNHRYDALIPIVAILLSLVFLALSDDFAGIRVSEYDPGAAYWPRAALIVVLIGSLVTLWKIYRTAKAEERLSEMFIIPGDVSFNLSDGDKRFIATIIIFSAYLFVIVPAGFVISTPFFLIITAWILGYRGKPIKLVLFALVTTILFFGIFINFNIALPNGTGAAQSFTIYLEELLSIPI